MGQLFVEFDVKYKFQANPNVVSEVVEWGGAKWHRYPNSNVRSRRVYYTGYYNKKMRLLHRAIWEHHNGPIPAGYEIHHDDDNPLNNDITNLKCLTPKQHRQAEAAIGKFSSPKTRANLDRIRPLANAWRATPEGKAWHAENGRKAFAKRKPKDFSCQHCGCVFSTKCYIAKYCSKSCSDKAYQKRRRVTSHTSPV